MNWDVVIVGAGHNGLAAAVVMAKAGKKVLVCEGTGRVGGLAAAEEFHPGYTTAGVWHETAGLRPWAVRQLGLLEHGLNWSPARAPVYVPVSGGRGYILHQDMGDQALGWERFQSFCSTLTAPLGGILNEPAVDLVAAAQGDVGQIWKPGLKMRKLGKKTLYNALRIPPMCVADWMREYFSNEALCAAVALPSVAHAFTGPWSPGTAGTLIHHELSSGGHAVGGPAAVTKSLHAAAKAASVEVRTYTGIKRIAVEKGRVSGVELDDGNTESCSLVVSTADPRSTVLRLLSPRDVAWQWEHRITHFRGSGTTAVLRMALSAPLRWKHRPDLRVARARLTNSLDGLEQSFDPVKYSEFTTRPALDVFIPTVEEPDLAPKGHEVVTVHAHAAPYDFEWTDRAREEFVSGIMNVLNLHAETPAVVHREFLTPTDIENRYATTQGHLLHGDHALDQLMIRPAPECAQYQTPIRGLFLAGSGSHPGGGLTCAPGILGAQTALKAK